MEGTLDGGAVRTPAGDQGAQLAGHVRQAIGERGAAAARDAAEAERHETRAAALDEPPTGVLTARIETEDDQLPVILAADD